jgi:hypothetical protein
VAATAPSARGRGNPWVILMVVSLGFFRTLLEKTFLRAQTPISVTGAHDPAGHVLDGEEKA